MQINGGTVISVRRRAKILISKQVTFKGNIILLNVCWQS